MGCVPGLEQVSGAGLVLGDRCLRLVLGLVADVEALEGLAAGSVLVAGVDDGDLVADSDRGGLVDLDDLGSELCLAARHDDVSVGRVDGELGAGVAVDVKETLQLPIYGVAALKTFGYQAKQVICTIVQPRCPHQDGPVRSVTFDVSDLLEFNADLEDAIAVVREAERANDLDPYLHPTEKACRWCKAAAICPALKAKATAMAKKVFTPQLPYNLVSLAETLEELPLIEAWIKNVREFAYQEAERGIDIPNHKLVEKIARRKWRDEGLVEDIFGGHALDLYEKKLISPAALEKLLPKEERGKLDELTVKESSGHALVHESDKRPAIKVDAATAFANL